MSSGGYMDTEAEIIQAARAIVVHLLALLGEQADATRAQSWSRCSPSGTASPSRRWPTAPRIC